MNQLVFEDTVSPEMRATITTELRKVEDQEKVRILFAVESGSRAWGFPSPDSDYDVRFVYARPMDWYLSLAPGRDVIELPIDGLLDINGWDIRKALGLLLKPNPVLLEWLSSPIRYLWNDAVSSRLVAFAGRVTHGTAYRNHYRRLGSRQWQVYLEDKERVNLKKYFYALRPALALRWVREFPDRPPPMNFQQLAEPLDLRPELMAALQDLLAAKSRSKELGDAPRIPQIDAFITDEFAIAEQSTDRKKPDAETLRPEADTLFREIIRMIDGE